MSRIYIPTRAWGAFAWVALAANPKAITPILGFVKIEYTPAGDGVPQITMTATDRYRVHRVIVELDSEANAEAVESWAILVPVGVVTEAAKHPTVGKSKTGRQELRVDFDRNRIEAGDAGWGAAYPDNPGNFPPVERLIPDNIGEHEVGSITLNMHFLADLAKYKTGAKATPDADWELHWTETTRPGKPGPVVATRDELGIEAIALIQPALRLS